MTSTAHSDNYSGRSLATTTITDNVYHLTILIKKISREINWKYSLIQNTCFYLHIKNKHLLATAYLQYVTYYSENTFLRLLATRILMHITYRLQIMYLISNLFVFLCTDTNIIFVESF